MKSRKQEDKERTEDVNSGMCGNLNQGSPDCSPHLFSKFLSFLRDESV